MGVHILTTGPYEEVHRRQVDEGVPRWCFRCRARHPFELVVKAPVIERPAPGKEGTWEPPTSAYYGPIRQVECATCHTVDGDCSPGTQRSGWTDEPTHDL